MTFRQWNARACRLANALRGLGLAKGDRVAVLAYNCVEWLEIYAATAKAGLIAVPVNFRLVGSEIRFIVENCDARAMIVEDALLGAVEEVRANLPVPAENYVHLGGSACPAGYNAYEDLLAAAADDEPNVDVRPDDPWTLMYTSGTTGRPKGAVLTHGNLTWNVLNAIVDYDVTRDEVAMMMSPMFHVAALSMGALPALLKGGSVVLHERFDAGAVLRAVEEHGVTSLSGVPTTFQFLAEHPDWDGTDLSSIRKLTCGGSAMPLRVIEAYERRGLAFSSGYGMTEASPGATSLPVSKARDHVGTSGLAHFFTDVRVVGPDGAELPPGEAGEIQISGPNVIREYWRRPEATAEAHDGPWFRSGDVGMLDAEGYLTVTDRLKDMIISGGENVYPAEIEQLVMEMPAVRAVAVIGVPDERWGEVPLAVVALHDDAGVTPEDILGHLAGRLAKYKVPRAAVVVDDLPRTATGKVRKIELRERFPALPGADVPR